MTPPVYTFAEDALKRLRQLLANAESFNRTQELINTLLEPTSRLVLYLGSGCSKSVLLDKTPQGRSHYRGKSWHELLLAMFVESGLDRRTDVLQSLLRRAGHEDPPTSPTLDDLLSRFDRLQVASFISAEFVNAGMRNRAIGNLVEPVSTQPRRSRLYEALMCFPFDEIVTTNYDSNIDWFLKHSRRHQFSKHAEIFDKDTLVKSFSNKEDFRLLYLHGKAGQRDLVFDRFDYARLMTERDGLLDFATYLLRDSSTVYVGFGLDDPSFNLMEDRLFSLDREHRPSSFAMVPVATAKERELWGRRHLFLIEYGEHERLPRILEDMNTVREFLIWAEPNRPARVALDDDRTATYLDDALLRYTKGEYAESLALCRAALATTLFWQRAADTYGLLGQRARKLCQIRVRLALDHYKLRLSDQAHFERIDLNLREAEEGLRHPGRAVRAHEWLPYSASAGLLRARLLYHDGRYWDAQRRYADTIAELSSAFGGPPTREMDLTSLESFRSVEAYYYAVCQKSRIDYQLIAGEVEDPAPTRIAERDRLEVISEDVRWFRDESDRRRLAAAESSSERQEFSYLVASFERIAHIAAWTAGRHGVGVFRGAVPWREERTEEKREQLGRAVKLLETNLGDGLPASGWVALRSRYLARGHVLRWLIQRHLHPADRDTTELRSGYAALQAAFLAARGQGLERQVVLNLLEAARINILVLFGEQMSRRHPSHPLGSPLGSPLTEAAGLYYLNSAFARMHGRLRPLKGIHVAWLDALGSSLAAYYTMVVESSVGSPGALTDKELQSVFEMSVEQRASLVAEKYGLCGEGRELGRASLFKRSYETLQQEFGNTPT